MILAERKPKVKTLDLERFGEAMPDGRLTAPSDGKTYNLRDAIKHSEKLGRPLLVDEMKQFER